LGELTNLKTLILSFNEIEEIESLSSCHQLLKLDLHNNFIRKVKGLESKDKLTYLDLTYNWIDEFGESLEHLKKNCPSLKDLFMKCNPISIKRGYRTEVFDVLQNLNKLDGEDLV